ncbi:hypothetical protein [Curtobacterium sp. RRHDQ10]|uniref:hypothetical protein n=1 Tax=Curtobacterium phyllosphaerae TaxID=3413379 RepID=UPI003BF2E64D
MRNRIILIGVIVAVGYWLGVRATRPVVRDPKVDRQRAKRRAAARKQLVKTVKKHR